MKRNSSSLSRPFHWSADWRVFFGGNYRLDVGVTPVSRSRWSRGLWPTSAAAGLLESWVRIPLEGLDIRLPRLLGVV